MSPEKNGISDVVIDVNPYKMMRPMKITMPRIISVIEIK
jgi:hypothetical protein